VVDRIPILKLGDVLLVTIQVDMHDQIATALEEDLTARIVSSGARGVLIDISALEIVDSFIGRMLANIASMARVLDARTVVVGMRPAVAITLVELGLSLLSLASAHPALAISITVTGLPENQEEYIDFSMIADALSNTAPKASFIPEIWQGHKNGGEGFWVALERLEEWL
jgi:rsbT antagonist protein RsbS